MFRHPCTPSTSCPTASVRARIAVARSRGASNSRGGLRRGVLRSRASECRSRGSSSLVGRSCGLDEICFAALDVECRRPSFERPDDVGGGIPATQRSVLTRGPRAFVGRRVENRLETPCLAGRILPRKQRGPRSRGRDAAVKHNLLRREAVDATGLSQRKCAPRPPRLRSVDVESRLPRRDAGVVHPTAQPQPSSAIVNNPEARSTARSAAAHSARSACQFAGIGGPSTSPARP